LSAIKINFAKSDGLIPAIVQDTKSSEVLMLEYQNQVAFELTQKTGYAHFFSRSRKEIWKKGETSGNILRVLEIWTDCDYDAIILKVASDDDLYACHTGARSCFFKKI
jgi:phosphoribosyl-AMP cyclohydrolase / phosphoribosyl-ATP pyrophosphohydrolase